MSNNQRKTIQNIAEIAGVSVTTVSRVLNQQAKKYRISNPTAERVRAAAAEIGYIPNQLARSLRTRRTNTIGLIIPDISNPFFSTIARSIEINARRAGCSTILSDCQEDTQLEEESLKLLQGRDVDGLLICPVGEEYSHFKVLVERSFPLVLIDRYFPELNCAYVSSDNYQGAYDAVSYFIENGHRNIACIQGKLETSVNRERVEGYRQAHIDHGLDIDEDLIIGNNFGKNNGYVGVKILLSRRERPTAVFATSNLISLGAMSAVIEEGLSIPDDISMISFDDQPYSDYLLTPMTTVTQQSSEIGQIAFAMLQQQIQNEGQHLDEQVKLKTKLILRKSVRRLEGGIQQENVGEKSEK